MKIIVMVLMFFFSPLVLGATASFGTYVDRTLNTVDAEFGGCMFRPTVPISETLDCPDTWLTLDCAGALGGSKSEGKRKYDELLLALITNRKVTVRVDDEKKINGWCYVDRVQLRR